MMTPRSGELTVESLESKVFKFISFVAEIACLVKAYDKGFESISIPQLRGKLLRVVGIGNTAYAHTVKMTVGRIKILNENGLVAHKQALSQALGVGPVGKRAHLH